MVMNKITIRLFLDGAGWMSETNDPEIVALLGTGLLPTPFLRGTSGGEALSFVQKLNPNAEVILTDI